MKYIVSKSDIEKNIDAVKNQAGDSEVIGVVKGNGYGFGTEFLAGVLKDRGITKFAVTEVSDLSLLRENVLKDSKFDILMLRSTSDPAEVAEIAENGGTFTIGSFNSAYAIEAYALSKGVKLKAHIKVDTGMGRYGFLTADDISKVYDECPNILFEGIYTHFSSAFTNSAVTRKQLSKFLSVTEKLTDRGYSVGIRHCANSSALFNVPESRLDAVRTGSALAGRILGKNADKLTRVGYISSTVIDIKTLPAGHTVGYNGTYVTKRETVVGIIPVGHFDGWGIQNKQEIFSLKDAVFAALRVIKHTLGGERTVVSIGNKSYPVIGQIGLSHTAVDITGSEVAVGDIVKLDTSPLNINPQMEREYIE